ncbi:MAG: hypothetical protein KDA89_04850 [Planctomycetaceae bacterium]|nr:hypothetical protein [Planctomycetaceae bacterium]
MKSAIASVAVAAAFAFIVEYIFRTVHGIPYNILEICDPNWRPLRLAGVCVAMQLLVWPSAWLARLAVSHSRWFFAAAFGFPFVSAVSFLTLRTAATEETLHDILGAPVLSMTYDV